MRWHVFALGLLTVISANAASASTIVPSNFNGYGTSVGGYQDFFTGTTLNAGWLYHDGGGNGAGVFTLPGDGTLHMNAANGDPNKLLYNGQSYDASNQNVLAMIEVTGGDNSDGFRGGIAAQSSSSSGQGINTLFRQQGNGGDPGNNLGNHVNLLNDGVAWGPAAGGANSWNLNTFYWLRETTDSSGNITAAIWAADGVTPESSAVVATWNQGGRSGLAGLVSDSGGNGTFQVNYILIQANGLGPVTAGVVPEPASLALFGVGVLGLGLVARRRRQPK